jgi:hypothetical protein
MTRAAMADSNEPVAVPTVGRTTTRDSGIEDFKNSESHIEEIVIARLTEEDIFRLSEESMSMWSWAGFRICLIMFVQGCNQAGNSLFTLQSDYSINKKQVMVSTGLLSVALMHIRRGIHTSILDLLDPHMERSMLS